MIKCWNCGTDKELTKAHIFSPVDGLRIGRTLNLCRNCHDRLDFLKCSNCKKREIWNRTSDWKHICLKCDEE